MNATSESVHKKLRTESIYMTYEEVAQLFRVCKRTIRRRVDVGILPEPREILGVLRFLRADIDQFIEQNGNKI